MCDFGNGGGVVNRIVLLSILLLIWTPVIVALHSSERISSTVFAVIFLLFTAIVMLKNIK